MSRTARIYFPGLSVHLIHRGINRNAIFGDDADRELFLLWFRSAMARNAIDVHVMSLMTNHYHAVVTPPSAMALPKAMCQLGVRYVQYFNRKYDRIGTLWTGRHRAIPIGDENYFLKCFRYIELNPVRAGIVPEPADYRWSSYRRHALGHPSDWDWLVEHAIYTRLGNTAAERQAAYRALCDQPLTETDLMFLRLARENRSATLLMSPVRSGLDQELQRPDSDSSP